MKTTTILSALCALLCSAGTLLADAPLRPGDSFDLRIGGVPAEDMNISSSYTVDGEGYLNLAYLNKLHVAGMTASQIQSLVEKAYIERGIFTHPSITLTVAAPRYVNVSGAVHNPTRVAYTADMTVMTAINAAGDFNDFANERKVRLSHEHGNVVEIVDCKKVRQDPSKDRKVLPGDSIQVPESPF